MRGIPTEVMEENILSSVEDYSKKIADNIGCEKGQVKEILERRLLPDNAVNYDTGSIEYRAAEFLSLIHI